MAEWIEWKGGDRPVGWHTKVDYKLVGIDKVFSDIAGHLRWGDAEGAEIVLYRPSKQQSMEEAYDETHKEIGDSALDVQVGGDHYKKCGIQPVEYINANKLDFFQGNVVKYITRHTSKGKEADVRKAIHFCNLILELQYGEGK